MKFLGAQFSESDGVEQKRSRLLRHLRPRQRRRIGQALLQAEFEEPGRPAVHPRTQRAGHGAHCSHARMKDRADVRDFLLGRAGATNMVTGAALATINRLPVLLLPADTFADRSASPLLQELLDYAGDVTVNDAFCPVSKYFDRVFGGPSSCRLRCSVCDASAHRPRRDRGRHRLFPPGRPGPGVRLAGRAVRQRVWHIARPLLEASVLARAAEVIRSAERPLIVAGGGVHYSGATEALRALCESTGIPAHASVPGGQGHAGLRSSTVPRGHRLYRDHRRERRGARRGRGDRPAPGTPTSPRPAGRLSRLPTCNSSTSTSLRWMGSRCRAQRGRRCPGGSTTVLLPALDGYRVDGAYVANYGELNADWDEIVQRAFAPSTANGGAGGLLTQGEVIGAVIELSDPRDVVVCAAGSMPGDLHKLWRTPGRQGLPRGVRLPAWATRPAASARLAAPDRTSS